MSDERMLDDVRGDTKGGCALQRETTQGLRGTARNDQSLTVGYPSGNIH